MRFLAVSLALFACSSWASTSSISGTWRFVDAACTRANAKKLGCKAGDTSYFQVTLARAGERVCGRHESILGLESARQLDAPEKGQLSVWGKCLDRECTRANALFDSKFSESPAGEGLFELKGDKLLWRTAAGTGVGNWPVKAVLNRVEGAPAVTHCPGRAPAWTEKPKQWTTQYR